MRAAELFAGAGGMGLGLYEAGFDVLWAGEMARWAAETHRHAFPEVPLVQACLTGDEELPPDLDLIVGGPPCQPFSSAGHRRGEWDPRDGFPVILRAIERNRPRAVLIENVQGFLSPRHEAYRVQVLSSLEDLGYSVEFALLNAADYGVPQQRRRVFIVGLLDGGVIDWPAPTHSLEALVVAKLEAGVYEHTEPSRAEQAKLRLLTTDAPREGTQVFERWSAARVAATLQPWVTVRDALGDLVQAFEPGATEHAPPGWHPEGVDYELVDVGVGGEYGPGLRSKSKRTLPDMPSATVQAAAEQKGSEHALRVALCVRNLGAGDGNGALPDMPSPTVPAKVGGQSGLAVMDAASEKVWTGGAGTAEPGRVHRMPSVLVRRLSPLEVARLQAFPDWWPWCGPVTQVYRQVGNAVPPPLARVVAGAIYDALT